MSPMPKRAHRDPRPRKARTGIADAARRLRDARERISGLERANAALAADLARAEEALRSFVYSVSHDLRAPLRAIDGFTRMVLEESAGGLDAPGRDRLGKVRAAVRRMGELIDGQLELSRIASVELRRRRVALSELARELGAELARGESGRTVAFSVEDGLAAAADAALLRAALAHLLGNAWKFTSRAREPRVAVGAVRHDGTEAFYVRDNGAGFDMKYAERLFRPYQRLHAESDFPGIGVGLAAVRRIVERHGGRVWAHGEPGRGASFYFTLPTARAA